jgi:hypothetical protein
MKRVFSHPLIALALGVWLRLFFLLKFPATSGDTALYEELATNWLKHGAYAMNLNGAITPVDVRMPGYPAFLALIYAITRHTGEAARVWVMLGQVASDFLGCVFVAFLAVFLVRLADDSINTRPIFRAGFWLAALCPFTANYDAVLLTESVVTCISAVSLVLLVRLAGSCADLIFPRDRLKASWDKSPEYWAALFGLSVGAATLFRPESPILFIAAWLALGWFFWKHRSVQRWFKLALVSGLFCVVSLSPWTIRNAITLHEVQFLAPKNTTLPSEVSPVGFMAWEKTWLYRLNDCYAVTWKLGQENINLEDIPSHAFDSNEEKQRVAAILAKYNQDQNLTPEEDAEFAEIARQRNARHPLRTYFWVPFQRVLTIWLTPRIELLPFSGNVFPLMKNWEDDRVDQTVTAGFSLLNIVYLVLAFLGAWRLCKWSAHARPALLAIAAYLILRTAFLTTVEAPEPRYVLVCFPAILALGATLFASRRKLVAEPQ